MGLDLSFASTLSDLLHVSVLSFTITPVSILTCALSLIHDGMYVLVISRCCCMSTISLLLSPRAGTTLEDLSQFRACSRLGMDNPEDSHQESLLLNEPHRNECGKPNMGKSHYSADSTYRKPAQETVLKPPPAELFRQGYLFILVSLYSILTLVAWVIICIQNKRPLTAQTYHYVANQQDWPGVLAGRMRRNADWFRAVKVLLAITNSLNIPLTSTICASVAVFYVQSFGRRRHLSMQHTSTLADKGWTSPPVWLALLKSKGWRSRGSYFLVFAMAIHALGTSDRS